ncbi:uncharacterized protein LOC128391611 [Panonychus citri]|uniref:uncharacterized protein LOC128391611 n=1 Tax=Panonychus citri TaxID=50023 RepID=UPI0023080971|nr:uncharacterized protein LOC128391611 [Panonychus citri]
MRHFNCCISLICILFIVSWIINCDSVENCNCDENNANQTEFNLNCLILCDNIVDGTNNGRYGYELTSISEEGPFFLFDTEEKVNLRRSDIRDGQSGVKLHLIVRLINSLTCEPMKGVYVFIWQANAKGVYSGVDNGQQDGRQFYDPNDFFQNNFRDFRDFPDRDGEHGGPRGGHFDDDDEHYRPRDDDRWKWRRDDGPPRGREDRFTGHPDEPKPWMRPNEWKSPRYPIENDPNDEPWIRDEDKSTDQIKDEKETIKRQDHPLSVQLIKLKSQSDKQNNLETINSAKDFYKTIKFPKPIENSAHRPDDYSNFKKFPRQRPINEDRFLRGYQSTNHHGDASFITVIPGWYRGRSQHIHIEIYLDIESPENVAYVGQLYFPTDDRSLISKLETTKPYNQIPFSLTSHEDDEIFQQSKGNELIISLEPIGNGYQGIVTIGVDPTITIKPFLD